MNRLTATLAMLMAACLVLGFGASLYAEQVPKKPSTKPEKPTIQERLKMYLEILGDRLDLDDKQKKSIEKTLVNKEKKVEKLQKQIRVIEAEANEKVRGLLKLEQRDQYEAIRLMARRRGPHMGGRQGPHQMRGRGGPQRGMRGRGGPQARMRRGFAQRRGRGFGPQQQQGRMGPGQQGFPGRHQRGFGPRQRGFGPQMDERSGPPRGRMGFGGPRGPHHGFPEDDIFPEADIEE